MNEVNLHQLRVFRAVVRHGSISRASVALDVSQPSVTAQVRALEQRLGITLLDRHASGVTLTDAGRLVDEYGSRLLELADELEQTAADIRGLKVGRLRIGGSTTIGEYVLPRLIGQFHAAHPGIRLQIEIRNTAAIVELVREHRLDIGFIGDAVDDERLDVEPISEDELVLVTSPEHPLAALPAPVAVDALSGIDWIVREPGSATRQAGERCLRRLGVSITTALELGSTEAIKQAVIAGHAASVVSRHAIRAEVAAGLLAVIPIVGFHCTRRFYVISPRGVPLTQAERSFRELARSRISDNSPGE